MYDAGRIVVHLLDGLVATELLLRCPAHVQRPVRRGPETLFRLTVRRIQDLDVELMISGAKQFLQRYLREITIGIMSFLRRPANNRVDRLI